MSTYDFGAAIGEQEAFHPSVLPVLPKGNYVVTIVTLDNERTGNGNPILKLRLECDEGVQWDNIVISPNDFAIQKLLGLIESAGLERPDPKKKEIDPKDGALSDAYAQKLLGRQVGLLVREEIRRVKNEVTGQWEDSPEGEMAPRVRGYCEPEKLNGHTGPMGDNKASAPKVGPSGFTGGSQDDDIPF